MDFQDHTQPDNGQNPAHDTPVMPEPQTAQTQSRELPEQSVSQTQETPIQEQPVSQTQEMPIQEQQVIPQTSQGQSSSGSRMTQAPDNSYGYGNPNAGRNGQPYQNNRPYQNNVPYGGGYPNHNYPAGGNNAYPYYDRSAYQTPYAEPGSSLANTAMILGIISIVASFTFTVYPAFILGSIAIILALLSKGSRSSHFQKARTGIICGTIGLVTNTMIVIFSLLFVFTNPEANKMFNDIFEQQYGMTFEEMMEEIEDNMYGE